MSGHGAGPRGRLRVVLLSPVPLDAPQGNSVTVGRIAQGLRARGVDVDVVSVAEAATSRWPGEHQGARPSLVHAFHAYRTGPLGRALAEAWAVPLIVTLTGTDVSEDLCGAVRGPVVREVLRAAAAVVAFHDSVGAAVQEAAPALRARLVIVPQGIGPHPDLREARGAKPALAGDPCVLFPTGIRPVKRPRLPLASLDGLVRRRPGARLWFVGPALDPDETTRLEEALRPRPWARYLGAMPHHEMLTTMRAADIVLNCSLSEGGMANTVLEALSLGRAVLASDIPGNRSVVQDGVTGLLFDSESALAEKAERLVGDPELRRRLGEAGRRLVATSFTSQRETDGYLALYARVVRGAEPA